MLGEGGGREHLGQQQGFTSCYRRWRSDRRSMELCVVLILGYHHRGSPLAPQLILTSSSSTYTRSVCYLMTAFPCTFKYLSGTCSLPTELLPQAQNSGSQQAFALCQGPNGQQLHCSPSTRWAKTRAVLQRIAPSRFVSVTQLLSQPSPLSNQRLFRYQLPYNGALNRSFTVIQSFLRCVSTKEMASQSTHTKPMPAAHRLARRPQTKLSVSRQLLNLA